MATDGHIINTDEPSPNPRGQQLIWHSVSSTRTGYVRKVNEDAHLDSRENALWAVADGMGGHSFGDKASRTVIEQLAGFTNTCSADESLKDIEARLLQANEICREEADGKIMGTTVAAFYACAQEGYFIWAGDSRIYRYRNNTLTQLTEDHSYVQELVSLGEITREEMEQHPSSNIITRAVGVHHELEIEVAQATVKSGDRYLICTDGLFKDLTRVEIESAMGLITADESLSTLVEMALDRGGRDNITAIVVQASG